MSERRALFLLGGGLMQLPAVDAAHRLDLEIYLADGNAQCAARDLVDHFYHIDLKDTDGLLRQARLIPNLAGVFTAGTDFSSSVAYVAERLGLPGIPHRVSMQATDKSRMRSVLDAAGVPVPRFRAVTVWDRQTRSAIEAELRYPLVVKPVDNMGARGVRRIDGADDLSAAIAGAVSLSRSATAIVEELIDGREYSLDAIVTEDAIRVTGIGERHIFFSPYFVELGHTIPAHLASQDRAVLEKRFREAIRAIGITRGAAKGDVFLVRRDDGTTDAVIGEIAARLSGGFMSGWTYPYATSVPLTELGVRVALGETPDEALFAEREGLVTVERALISAPGVVREVEVAAPTSADPVLRDLFVHCRVGDTVGPPSNNVEKIANAIATADRRTTAERAAADGLDRVLARLEVGHQSTERFLFADGWCGRFARYGGEQAVDTVRVMPPIVGRDGTKPPIISEETPLPVREIDSEQIALLQVGIAAIDLLARLQAEGEIILVPASSSGDAFGSVFWRAFFAAGRQGVAYLRDAVAKNRLEAIISLVEKKTS